MTVDALAAAIKSCILTTDAMPEQRVQFVGFNGALYVTIDLHRLHDLIEHAPHPQDEGKHWGP